MTTALSLDVERAVIAVLLRYATAIDTRDWLLFRSCFADDFAGDYGPGKVWDGADAITRYMRERHRDLGATLHRVGNIVIAPFERDGAAARSYVDAILMPGIGSGEMVEAAGIYDDRLARVAGQWRIRSRRFTLVRLRQSSPG